MTEEEITNFIDSYDKKPQRKVDPKRYNPIHCHLCGSENIEFVAEYHKAVFLRILASVSILLAVIFSIDIISDIFHLKEHLNTAPIIISLVAYVILKSIIYFVENRTHIKAICRDCGNIWVLENS